MPYIASGAYACAFRPYLECTKATSKAYVDGVGKVFYSDNDFDTEVKINNIVNKIDPQHKHTIQMYDTCETKSNYRSTDNIQKCKTVDMAHTSFKQIIYRNGGKSLIQHITTTKGTPKAFEKLFKGLLNVLEGLEKVNAAGYVHQDIKPDNILINKIFKRNTDDPNAYIIDFGIIEKKENIYMTENTTMLKYDYPYFPPEYKAFVYDKDFNTFLKAFNGNFFYGFSINGKNEYIKDSFPMLNIDMKIMAKDAFDTLKGSDFSNFTSKVDLYSFGIVLLMCFIWSKIPDKAQALKQNRKRVTRLGTINQLMCEYLRGIIHLNPQKRFTIAEALEFHKRIIKAF